MKPNTNYQGGLTDAASSTYSAIEMAHEWYEAGRPWEMRSAQAYSTTYDCQATIDFDYLTAYLVRLQHGEKGDFVDYIAIFRSPGDKLQVEWYTQRMTVPFFDHTSRMAYDAIQWFTSWAEEMMDSWDPRS